MKTLFLFILLFIPFIAYCQSTIDNYAIYSDYLKLYQETKHQKANYIIRVSGDYGKADGNNDIKGMITTFRGYVHDEKDAASMMGVGFRAFRDTLKIDTLWIPLIERLSQSIRKKFIIQNKFSEDLNISLLTYNHYAEYFVDKEISEGWDSFHEDYPGYSYLTELSVIVNDDKRAVFYFSTRCGGLCGRGQLVLFYKDVSGWRFAGVLPIWDS